MTLDRDDIEAIAELVVRKLRDTEVPVPTAGLVDVNTLAGLLGLSTDYVYEHARRLGGVKAGTGPKARWRFDVDVAKQSLADPGPALTPVAAAQPRPAKRRGRPAKRAAQGVELIPIRP